MTNFEDVIERKGTRSVKWDFADMLFKNEGVLPMWVADMDFQVPEAVTKALQDRVSHGIFGYTMPDDEVKQTIVDWVSNHYDYKIEKDWIFYSPGVVPSLHMLVQALSEVGDHVLIQTPVYPPFYSIVKNHGRHIVKNQLTFDGERYEIDFDDFEQKIEKNNVSLFILCSPHNPIGRVWTKEELQKMADICLKHGVTILSDEIHADLVLGENEHTSIASLSEDIDEATVTCYSPTKTFNLAGLQASYVVAKDKKKRKRLERQFHGQGINMLNTLGLTALEAAYRDGEEWLEGLREKLAENVTYARDRLHKETDSIRVIEPEGTYLLWLDCRGLGLEHEELKTFMQEKAKLGLNDGASFGEEGKGFMRMNIAAPKETVVEGVERLIQAVQKA
ncbi:MalY/PatB family protein [Salimicrobium halophilum]|uniref:cysteine-S-conjugate beta-lyase n=1 Tax=Salimicrobium halophilum TaxID=86666 RepID=A0A1G8VB53_9BACI|nr:MalY/PatB family protein [Salimicrobium halophilum]SDJ63189.1 cystathione beta-lyase [Salimicrobium halophilum]